MRFRDKAGKTYVGELRHWETPDGRVVLRLFLGIEDRGPPFPVEPWDGPLYTVLQPTLNEISALDSAGYFVRVARRKRSARRRS